MLLVCDTVHVQYVYKTVQVSYKVQVNHRSGMIYIGTSTVSNTCRIQVPYLYAPTAFAHALFCM